MTQKHILHLVTKLPDKYNGKFIEFSEKHLIEYQHTYVALVSTDSVNEERELSGANIVNLNNLSRLQKMKKLVKLFLSSEYDLVLFHGLSYTGPFLFFLAVLFKVSKLAEKTLWLTWGGDIYYFQNRPNTLSGYFNEVLRKSIIKKLFFTSSLIPAESDLIKVNYDMKAIQFDGFYPNPVGYEDIDDEAPLTSSQKFTFMVGNSADPQNNHLEMLQSLAHLQGNIKIYCVLSYAIVDRDYVNRVQALGNEIFGNDFIPLTEFMNTSEYKRLIERVDFSCYYHNRQQALGNIFQFLYLGKAVFIRRDILSFDFLQSLGFDIHDSNSLSILTLEELTEIKRNCLKDREKNKMLMNDNFSDLAASEKWTSVLRRVFALLKKSS